jgi:hypothetical protein
MTTTIKQTISQKPRVWVTDEMKTKLRLYITQDYVDLLVADAFNQMNIATNEKKGE